MKIIEKSYDVGVMVARFQVPDLHDAHIQLVESVKKKHSRVILFLGLSPVLVTRNNPLDFEARKQMVQAKFPDVTILYIKDQPSNEAWSKNLDAQIKDMTPNLSVVLYGGRDSFLKYYSGKYATREFEQTTFVSGTQLREEAAKRSKTTPDFRAGVIHAAHKQYPKVYPTVDVAIYDPKEMRLLMARKPAEEKYRFVGGFADPGSDSFEADAIREVKEETGLDIVDPQYIGSFKVDDWRYRNEVDKIRTLFFVGLYTEGTPQADDDISEIRWMTIGEIHKALLVNEHHMLFDALDTYLSNHKFFQDKK